MIELLRAFREGWQTESYFVRSGRGPRLCGKIRRGEVWAWNRLREKVSYAAAPWLHGAVYENEAEIDYDVKDLDWHLGIGPKEDA